MGVSLQIIAGRFSRRSLLLGAAASVPAMGAATAALALPTATLSPAAPAEHPDAALFALDQEMEEAHAAMQLAYRVVTEIDRKVEKLYPPEPAKWEEPLMPDHLLDMLGDMPLGTIRHPNLDKQPEPLRERDKACDEQKAAHQALREAYLEQVEAINREGGLNAAEDAFDALSSEHWEIGQRIFETPAHTLEGMEIKLRAADRLDLRTFAEDGNAFSSIAADIKRLAAASEQEVA